MRSRHILLVEDNPDDETLTRMALLDDLMMSHEIVVVRDGVEALDYLFGRGAHAEHTPGQRPNVVVLDLKLPKLDGLDVLRALRADERTKLLPVVVLTSSNEESDRLAAYGSGANSYVQKPIEFSQFSEAVKQIGRYWLDLNQPVPLK